MWRKKFSKAYPFHHEHPNHFPPFPRHADDGFANGLHEAAVDGESPIAFMGSEFHPEAHRQKFSSSTFDIVLTTPTPTERPQRKTLLASFPLPDVPPPVSDYFQQRSRRSDPDTPPIPVRRRPSLILQPISIPPPQAPLPPLPPSARRLPTPKYAPMRLRDQDQDCSFPPTPSSQAPEKMTSLLSEVLSIMNTIMEQQHTVQQEDRIVAELTELVVIMQEEAEALLNLADLVEEFVEEVDVASEVADIESWVEELHLDCVGGSMMMYEDESMPGLQSAKPKPLHGRDGSVDSAVSLSIAGDELGAGDGPYSGELRESLHRDDVVHLAQVKMAEREQCNLMDIGRRAVQKSEEEESKAKKKDVGHRKAASLGGAANSKKPKPTKKDETFRDSGLGGMSPISSVCANSKMSPKSKSTSKRGTGPPRVRPPRWL
ncbi:uncharacterized protein L3040_002739 [Drepanopeziza brunnea f. sp. 'multigermtubi']|uniref:uncharacterized protein n=1 Tax=Drepanopeziza brunnea f. sp. 'multigermtubi' TaxID=698441 RepID=UPI00238477CB|nr:hypothetical protein L3040_002739 [Drepanopeziza brunnea f. sp. 'multigermtubi']